MGLNPTVVDHPEMSNPGDPTQRKLVTACDVEHREFDHLTLGVDRGLLAIQ